MNKLQLKKLILSEVKKVLKENESTNDWDLKTAFKNLKSLFKTDYSKNQDFKRILDGLDKAKQEKVDDHIIIKSEGEITPPSPMNLIMESFILQITVYLFSNNVGGAEFQFFWDSKRGGSGMKRIARTKDGGKTWKLD